KVSVYRKQIVRPFVHIAKYSAYVQLRKDGKHNNFWAKMPDHMLAKCFSRETEILTDQGFQPFPSVTGRIMEVTDSGLRPTDSIPFVQVYSGEMITYDADMLNFSVTPNHTMITQHGRIDAEALHESSRCRSFWRLPLCHGVTEGAEADIPDEALLLTGYVAAAGRGNVH